MLLSLLACVAQDEPEFDRKAALAELRELKLELDQTEVRSRREHLQMAVHERLVRFLTTPPWSVVIEEHGGWLDLLFELHETLGRPDEELDQTLTTILSLEGLDEGLAGRLDWEMRRRLLRAGQPAPDWKLEGLEGDGASLKDFEGQCLLLYFWQSNTRSSKVLVESWLPVQLERFAGKLQVVGVSTLRADSLDALRQFATAHEVRWPLLSDPEGTMQSSYFTLGLNPYLCAIDEAGQILGVGRGWDGLGVVERVLADHLEGRP